MFKKNSFINTESLDVGVSLNTDEFLFGVNISLHLPGKLILVGIGPYALYVTTR